MNLPPGEEEEEGMSEGRRACSSVKTEATTPEGAKAARAAARADMRDLGERRIEPSGNIYSNAGQLGWHHFGSFRGYLFIYLFSRGFVGRTTG